MTAYPSHWPDARPDRDVVDLGELSRALRRRWPLIVGAAAAGLALAAIAIALLPRRYEGRASIIVHSTDPQGSLLGRIAGSGSPGAGALLGDQGGTQIETEEQVLASRALLGVTVDSLALQVQVLEPAGLAARGVVQRVDGAGSFQPVKLVLEREGNGWKATGDTTATFAAGAPITVRGSTIVLRKDASLPAKMELRLLDREDAITRLAERLEVKHQEGEVVGIRYEAADSVTAAAVPNTLVAEYLARRKTVDRGANSRKLEFLTAQLDSVSRQLTAAEQEMRNYQERTGAVDANAQGGLEVAAAAELRRQAGTLDVEKGALDQLLAGVKEGRISERQLAAYPTFLRSPGINDLLRQMAELETERAKLLERRLESDAEVVAVGKAIQNLEGQLVPLATAYQASLARQRRDLTRQLDTLQASLGVLPGVVQGEMRRGREVARLTKVHEALQGQLVEVRLAAIGEGGDVRLLDAAQVPKKFSSPRVVPTLAAGLGGGLGLGLLLALMLGVAGRWVEDPRSIERATGVPTLRFDPGTPLLVSGRPVSQTVLIVPLGRVADTAIVARRLEQTALARGAAPLVMDFSSNLGLAPEGESAGAVLGRLEAEGQMVIARLPQLSSDVTAGVLDGTRAVLLVAPPGRVSRSELMGAVSTLRRMEVPLAGIILGGAERIAG
jgi:uncharacterized protein involved in exopolysaccharide biosynthesis